MSSITPVLEDASVAAVQKRYDDAERKYYEAIYAKFEGDDQNKRTRFLQDQETAIIELGKIYKNNKSASKLDELIRNSRVVLSTFAKSKTAKIVKTLIENFDKIPDSLDSQILAIKECIDWAVENKLSFLRQQLQLKLSAKLYNKGLHQEGLTIITGLLSEYKKLDDKSSLVEVQLVESQIYHALRNIPKSRAALTSARTSANSIYCPTLLQAELDCQSGILNAEEKDYKTAFSYFYESFEGFNSQSDDRAILVLKYMLLTKVMLNLIDDVNTILNNKNVIKYQSRDIDAMKSIATAYSNRSLKDFETSLTTYSIELRSDQIIKNHFNSLYDNLLEQNLLKIIESYSVVEISHISKTIGLNLQQVEGKLSQMILDKVFYGVLDQGNGWLIIYDQPRTDAAYEASLELVKNMSSVVDSLYEKASTLN
ncbi:PCI-domain-containing protein [Metschnikowia bicuspidata var. bicuspidata NRRL YB-4993]|uniref:PCI-domain-containing protein n=1 Tax=Metschnikowia bicuspidata var. bicuspidata NRRL YB-4993 TaxID=869754 RepID=A0A1A0HGQ2_9ASCO|nr:PCI-domain-containing protein [Metschnikowia bicuspidata var. bicuspidata NRRL YB-4993]OBA23354.1 PCI-domain-containing protein [Metschnikowia bicuspidata var. bicuspidata NRRL YB-4993]